MPERMRLLTADHQHDFVHEDAIPDDPLNSDPVEILAHREISIGINLRGLHLDADTQIKLSLEFNIDLTNTPD